MKPYNYLLIPILILPLLSSCAKEDKIDGPVSLNPYVAGISLTRAGASQASDLSAIGLYAVNQDKNLKTYGTWPAGTYGTYSNKQDGSFKPADAAQTIWLNLEKATIFACHPSQAAGTAITDGNAPSSSATNPIPCIPVPAAVINLAPANITAPAATNSDFDFATAANDYMYGVEYDVKTSTFKTTQPTADNGRAATNAAGNTVAIGLKHAFSQIKLIITKGPTYTGNAVVSNVIYSRSMQTLDAAENSGVKMQLTDGKLVGLENASSKEYQYNLNTLSDGGYKVTDNMTLTNYCLPNIAAASTITVVVDGKEMSIQYAEDPAWEAGKINTYNVTINGTGLTFSGFSIVDWNDSNDNNSSGTL